METRANYLLVGSFVLGLSLALLIFVIWIAKVQFDIKFDHYDIRFEGSVTGLKVGSAVSYRGITVGEVSTIGVDPDDLKYVLVTVEIQSDTPVRQDTVAKLQLKGITGGSFVLLTGGDQDSPPLETLPGRARPVIASEKSGIEKLFEGAPQVVENVNLLIAQAADLLNPENRAAISQTLRDVSVVTGTIASHSGDLESIIEDTTETLKSLRETAAALERVGGHADTTLVAMNQVMTTADRTIGSMSGQVESLIVEFEKTARAFRGVGEQVEAMVLENREPLRDFSSTGLYELSRVLTELRDLIIALSRVTTTVERDPALFFFGNQQQGYETNK